MDSANSVNNELAVKDLGEAAKVIERLWGILSGEEGSYLDYHVRFLDRLEQSAKGRWSEAIPAITNPRTISARQNRRGYYKNPPAADATLTTRFYWTGRLFEDATGSKGLWNVSGKNDSRLTVGPEDGRISDNVKRVLDETVFSKEALESIAEDAALSWIEDIVRKVRI